MGLILIYFFFFSFFYFKKCGPIFQQIKFYWGLSFKSFITLYTAGQIKLQGKSKRIIWFVVKAKSSQ